MNNFIDYSKVFPGYVINTNSQNAAATSQQINNQNANTNYANSSYTATNSISNDVYIQPQAVDNSGKFDYSIDDGKISFSDKIKNFAKGIISPITNLFKSPKNFLIGAGMIAAASLFMVATGGAAAPVFVTLGVTGGLIQFGTSAFKAATAKTDTEAKTAWQGIGAGTTAVGLSVLGAKKSLEAAGVVEKGTKVSPFKATLECFKKSPKQFSKIVNKFTNGEAWVNVKNFFGINTKPKNGEARTEQLKEETKFENKPAEEKQPKIEAKEKQPEIKPEKTQPNKPKSKKTAKHAEKKQSVKPNIEEPTGENKPKVKSEEKKPAQTKQPEQTEHPKPKEQKTAVEQTEAAKETAKTHGESKSVKQPVRSTIQDEISGLIDDIDDIFASDNPNVAKLRGNLKKELGCMLEKEIDLQKALMKHYDQLDYFRDEMSTEGVNGDIFHNAMQRVSNILHNNGVETIKPEINVKFNPENMFCHGTKVVTDPSLDETVAEIFRAGFFDKTKDGIIRPVEVILNVFDG